MITSEGLELDAPSPGDIVTVLIRPPSVKAPAPTAHPLSALFGEMCRERPEHENIYHYRHTSIWSVLATNGGQAVVKALTGYDKDQRHPEIWTIKDHRWFDASSLWAAMQEHEQATSPESAE